MIKGVQKIKQSKVLSNVREVIILNKMDEVGPTEKETFEKRIEGD